MKARAFTHIDQMMPSMVDISDKSITKRQAVAESLVRVPSWLSDLFDGTDINSKKGPVFHTAIIAGTMAVKNTAQLIPFCHTLRIDAVKFQVTTTSGLINILCTVKTIGKTGVEMEALTGASIAALTIYDMCKSLTHEIEIESTKLLLKSGGKSDEQSK